MQSWRSGRTGFAAMICAATLLSGGVLIASSGRAAAVTRIHAKYKVTGSTFLKAPNFTMQLGPGTLAANVNLTTGAITATLTLPDATGSFLQDGLIPVTATTRFINDGPTTGKLNLLTGAVQTTSKITLQVVSMSVAGVNTPVGDSCETSSPVVVSVKSLPGFNALLGGKPAGSYAIPQFQNCELATPLINLTIPGSGNTITLKARQGGGMTSATALTSQDRSHDEYIEPKYGAGS